MRFQTELKNCADRSIIFLSGWECGFKDSQIHFADPKKKKKNPDPDPDYNFFLSFAFLWISPFRGFLILRDFVNSAIFAILFAFTRFSSLPQFSRFSVILQISEIPFGVFSFCVILWILQFLRFSLLLRYFLVFHNFLVFRVVSNFLHVPWSCDFYTFTRFSHFLRFSHFPLYFENGKIRSGSDSF